MKKHVVSLFLLALYCPVAMADGGAVSRVLPSSNAATATQNGDGSGGAGAVSARTARINDANSTRINAAQTRGVSDAITIFDILGDNTAQNATLVRSGARVVNLSDRDDGASTSTGRRPGNIVSRSHSGDAGADGATSVRASLSETVSTVGRNARVTAASANSNPIVRRAGVTLRPSTAEVGGRAIIAGTDGVQTGSNFGGDARSLQSRAAKAPTAESIAEAKERLERTADLNKSCQEQYNECMDQFCAVVDANQKRCSCSANLSKYNKVESAVKDANNQLNDVAQRIRYVGLSADEITAILTETEAEEALSGKTDNTETRNMLSQIEKMIKDPTSTTSYSDTFSGLDLDLDFSADGTDMFSLDFLNTASANGFSNLRGSELYSAAKRRCNTVLNQCKSAGATPQQITGNYDLAIDKDCIAYEQGLTKMNETLISNVRSANLMLQKARLAVLQNKNQYDAKGCIAALETCMTDDMVCGDNYVKCLDPTKRYIDENGNVVLGQDITYILKFMDNFNNANVNTGLISRAMSNEQGLSPQVCESNPPNWKTASNADNSGKYGNNDGSCIVKYLMQKIGTGAKATDGGLCRPVLDKCQMYTYDAKKNYNPLNDVIVNYIQRAMVNIRAAQHQIISDYASTCMTDIASCYNKQVTQVNSWSSNASVQSIYNVMTGACYNVALTCAYAVFQHAEDTPAIPGIGITSGTNKYEECAHQTGASKASCYIYAISEIFYQSLLCPDHSTYVGGTNTVSDNGCKATTGSPCYVNSQCKCNVGYTTWGGACVVNCGALQERHPSYGTCVCVDNAHIGNNGTCTCDDGYEPNNTTNPTVCNLKNPGT